MGVDINMVVGRANQARKLSSEEEMKMDSENVQNVQTVVGLYFNSLKDRQNRHLLAAKYGNLSEASTADIEADAGTWLAGFASAIKLVDPKAKLPTLEMTLGGITKAFESEIAA